MSSTDIDIGLGQVLLNGMFVSTVLGVIGSALLFSMGDTLMLRVFGSNPSDIASRLAAATYLKIRSLSLPMVLMNFVVTGFSLGIQNVKIPVLSIFLSAFTNILGDYILVSLCGMGLTGNSNTPNKYCNYAIILHYI